MTGELKNAAITGLLDEWDYPQQPNLRKSVSLLTLIRLALTGEPPSPKGKARALRNMKRRI